MLRDKKNVLMVVTIMSYPCDWLQPRASTIEVLILNECESSTLKACEPREFGLALELLSQNRVIML